MEKFITLTHTAVPLEIENIDTDQIIPARFLKATDKAGFGENLFRDWRFDKEGNLKEEYVEKERRYQAEKESYNKEKENILRSKALTREERVDELMKLDPPVKPKRGDLISKSPTRTALIQALDEGAKLLAMSDYQLGEVNDEYRFDKDYFTS